MHNLLAGRKRLYCFTLHLTCLLLTLTGYAQSHATDSMLAALPQAKEDTNKVKLLYELSATFYNEDPEQGIKYGNQSLALAQSLKWDKGMAWAYNKIGTNYWALSNYKQALQYHHQALDMHTRLGDKDAIAQVSGNLGIVYGDMGEFSKALDYEQTAVDLYTSLNNKRGLLKNLGNMGTLYSDISNYPKALELYFKALKTAEELGDKKGIAINLNNLGNAYKFQENYATALEYELKAKNIFEEIGEKNSIGWTLRNIGVLYGFQQNYQKSLQYNLQALQIFNELNDQKGKATMLNDVGNVYSMQKDYSSAFDYYFNALKIFREMALNSGTASSYGNIGMNYLNVAKHPESVTKPGRYIIAGKQANLDKAIEYLQKSIDMSQEIGYQEAMLESMRYISEAYQMSGSYKQAIESYTAYSAIRDSMYSAKTKIAIANLEIIRELDKKGQEMQIKDKQLQVSQLKLDNTRTERFLYLALVVLLIVVVAFVVKSLRSERMSVQSLSKEKKKNLAHIEAQNTVLRQIAFDQSHRIRGAVTTILGLVNLFNHDQPEDEVNKVVIDGVSSVTKDLDTIVKDVVKKLNTVS